MPGGCGRGQDGPMSATSYRVVLRAPGVRVLLTSSLVARVPIAMVNLAIILRVAHGTGSYARAGAVTACYVLGTAAGTPLLGRVADRVGRRPVLVVAGALNAAGLIGLALVPLTATPVLFGLAVLAGASVPPVAPAVRSLWRELAPPGQASSLYAMDATLQEVTFMVGPALVALLSSLAGASAALATSGLIGLAGTIAVSFHPATATSARRATKPPVLAEAGAGTGTGTEAGTGSSSHPTGSQPTPPGPSRPKARTPALTVLSVTTGMFLMAIATVEVAVVAFAGQHHHAHEAGVLLVVWSAGSLVGGLSIGSRVAHAGARLVAPLMLAAAIGFAALSLAPGIPVLYPLLFAAGMTIAPGFSLVYDLVGRTSPPAASVEAFSWVASAIQVGASAGAALGGVLVEVAGTRASFAVAGAIGLLTALVAALGTPVLGRVERDVVAVAD